MKTAKIKIPIYHGWLIIVSYSDAKEVRDKYNLTDFTDCDALAWQDSDKPLKYFCAFENDVELHNIAHEVVHLVNMIFRDRDIILDAENDEPQAYLHGYLFQKIHFALKNWGKIKQ